MISVTSPSKQIQPAEISSEGTCFSPFNRGLDNISRLGKVRWRRQADGRVGGWTDGESGDRVRGTVVRRIYTLSCRHSERSEESPDVL